MTNDDVETQLNKLDFEYTLNNDVFHIIIPRRRLDVEANKADLAEEIGRLYGYNNLEDTLPKVGTKRGTYVGDVALRKSISKRLRCLGLTEVRTYTLTSQEQANSFNYDNKEVLALPNPMSSDKGYLRLSVIPGLLQTYEYNKARKVENINIYEIAKTYDINYQEDHKVAMLMAGSYITNTVNLVNVKVDFYLLKGVVENLLKYLGLKNRYDFTKVEVKELHPGVSAAILIDRNQVGIIGKVHPSITKDNIFVCELSLTKLYELTVKPLKFKASSKYPEIKKDVAFIVDNNLTNKEIEETIKKAGGRLLDSIDIFDIYRNIEDGKKSMAYSLVFKDDTRTLSDEEVMQVFNNIIEVTCSKLNAKVRDK